MDLNGSQSDLDNLKIKYTSPSYLPFLQYGEITEIYIEVEITLNNGEFPPEISNWQGIIIFFIIMISIIFLSLILIIFYIIYKHK